MVRKNSLTGNLLKWMSKSTSDQSVYERKLTDVMKSLKVQHYNFNWDRTSCYVEFHYNENFYRLEHSIEKAKKRGIVLNNGLDCLMELTQSLENLCSIIDRGINDFETWISGMKQTPSETMISELKEEFEMKYKTLERQDYAEFNKEVQKELIPFGTEPSPEEFEQNRINNRLLRDQARY